MAVDLDPTLPFLISPPFGAYFRHPRAYSVLGSFTVHPRPGRFGQILRTVRPLWVPDECWVNKIGLRNPGMNSLPKFWRSRRRIVSLAPLVGPDWHAFERWLDERVGQVIVEFNVSCPNVDSHPELPSKHIIKRLLASGCTVIFKLPPVPGSITATAQLAGIGVRYIHLSNTLPSPVGGISGTALREVNLKLVGDAVANLGGEDTEIIAGGGIYAPDHVRQYCDAGATRFSTATAWFWPPRAKRIM